MENKKINNADAIRSNPSRRNSFDEAKQKEQRCSINQVARSDVTQELASPILDESQQQNARFERKSPEDHDPALDALSSTFDKELEISERNQIESDYLARLNAALQSENKAKAESRKLKQENDELQKENKELKMRLRCLENNKNGELDNEGGGLFDGNIETKNEDDVRFNASETADSVWTEREYYRNYATKISRQIIGLKQKITAQKAVIDNMRKIHTTDSEDGERLLETTESTKRNVSQSMLPSVSKNARKVHKRFRIPFHCLASCTLCAIFFVMERMRRTLCSVKFISEIQSQLNDLKLELGELQKDLNATRQRNTEDIESRDEDISFHKCSSYFDALQILGLIPTQAVFQSEVINGVDELNKSLQMAADEMRKELGVDAESDDYSWFIILLENKEESGIGNHCMATRPFKDIRNPAVCVEVFDAQSGHLWPRETDRRIKDIHKFQVLKIDDEVAADLFKKCGLFLCKEESPALTRCPVSEL